MSNRKKVLIITNQSGFLWKFELNDVKLLQNLGYEVHYASNSNEEGYHYEPKQLEKMGIIYHNIEIARSPYMFRMNYRALKQLIDIIEKENIKLIHCHTPVGGFLGRLAGEMCHHMHTKPKVIYTAHGFHFYNGAPILNNLLYQTVERLMAPLTDVLILINKEDYIHAKTFHLKKGGKVYQIPGVGVDLSIFHPVNASEKQLLRRKIGIDNDSFFILSVGELNKNKNFVTIIRAIKKMTTEKLVEGKVIYGICGDGFFKNEIQQFAKELGLKDQVRFYGYKCNVRDYYAAADVTVFPSKREGLGMVGLESLAMGIPVIASDNRGTREYMCDGKNGYICKYDDVEGFINGIKKIYRMNDAERKKMKKACVDSVSLFSKSNSIKIMSEIYKEIDRGVITNEQTIGECNHGNL